MTPIAKERSHSTGLLAALIILDDGYRRLTALLQSALGALSQSGCLTGLQILRAFVEEETFQPEGEAQGSKRKVELLHQHPCSG